MVRIICAAAAMLAVLSAERAASQSSSGQAARLVGAGIDLQARGVFNQNFDFNSNPGLASESDGSIYGTRSRIGLRATARGKRAVFGVNAGVGYYVRGGSGNDDDDGSLDRLQPDIAANHAYNGKGYSITNGLNLSVRPVTETQFEDSGSLEDQLNQLTFSYNAGFARSVDSRNSLTLGGRVRLVRFDEETDNLDESERYSFNTTWRRRLSQTTSIFAQTGFSHFKSDDDLSSRSSSFTTGLNHERTPRHRFGVTGGATITRTKRILSGTVFTTTTEVSGSTVEILVVPVPVRRSDSDATVGFNGGASFDYQLPRLLAGINLSQGVDEGSDGEISTLTGLSGALRYRLTPQSSLSGSLSYSRRSDLGTTDEDLGTRHFFSFGPALSTKLTEDIDLGLNYRFRFNIRENEDNGIGHRVLLTISKSFTIID